MAKKDKKRKKKSQALSPKLSKEQVVARRRQGKIQLTVIGLIALAAAIFVFYSLGV